MADSDYYLYSPKTNKAKKASLEFMGAWITGDAEKAQDLIKDFTLAEQVDLQLVTTLPIDAEILNGEA